MQTKNSQSAGAGKLSWKKLLGAAALGTSAALPLLGSSAPAQAQAPTWGYGDRDNHGDYRTRDNRDYRYGDRNDNRGESRTLEGIVSNDRAGREFVLRLDSGLRVQVRSDEREPRRLSEGDRVRVRGYFERTDERNRNSTRYNEHLIFRADDVEVIRNRRGNDNNYGRRTLSGVVTDVRSDQRLTVRIDGRDYDVRSSSRLARDINRGDRVRIYGDVRGDDITNANVVLDRDYNGRYDGRYDNNGRGGIGDIFGGIFSGNGSYGGNNGSRVDFPATVIEANERARSLRVRGDNGREYTLRADEDEIDNLRRGDRVRITGRVQNGAVVVDDVDKI